MNISKLLTIIAVAAIFGYGCSASPQKEAALKDALKGRFYIGTALSTRQIGGKDTANVRIVQRHFDAIVAENCMKSMYLQPKEGEFHFEDADQFVEFGEQNGMWITGHCLIWHSQLPAWFCVDENGGNVTPEVLRARMKNHIATIAGRYKGRIHGWDVVNEAILDDGSYRRSKFYEILGEEFIPLAFQYAHEADPAAELYYNDYNEWYPGKVQKVVQLIKTLKERGIRIDAIGMQGHFGMNGPDIGGYGEAIEAYSNAGVKVMITELDLSILPNPRPETGAEISTGIDYRTELNPYTEGVPEEVMQEWTNRMLGFFSLFLKHQDKITRVTFWGVSDGVSWKNNFPVRGRTDYPLVFDRNYQAKPVTAEIIRLAKQTK